MKNEEAFDESTGTIPSLSPSDESTGSVNEKNNKFLENASQVLQRKIEQAQEYEEDHHILEKIREFTEDTYRNVVNWADEHKVVERSKTAAAQGTAFAMSKIQECVRPSIAAIKQSSTRTAAAPTEQQPQTEKV